MIAAGMETIISRPRTDNPTTKDRAELDGASPDVIFAAPEGFAELTEEFTGADVVACSCVFGAWIAKANNEKTIHRFTMPFSGSKSLAA